MTSKRTTGAVLAATTAPHPEEIRLDDLALRLKQAGKTVEACAYQAAGRTSAETVGRLIGLAADLERLARQLNDTPGDG